MVNRDICRKRVQFELKKIIVKEIKLHPGIIKFSN